MNPKYRFYLTIGSQSPVEVHPVWKDDLSLEFEKESQQQFFRRRLSGSIDFVRKDYELIMAAAFGTVFKVDIYISDNGGNWENYWRGKFSLTDCKVDVDHEKLTVKPEVIDEYNDILAGMEKEFDLIKLAPEIDKVQMTRRPCIQIFDMTSETVTCVCGNNSWEQEASMPTENQGVFVIDHCHFYAIDSPIEVKIKNPPAAYSSDLTPSFTGTLLGDGSTLTNTPNTFYIRYWESYRGPIAGGFWNGFDLINRADPDIYWKFEQHDQDYYPSIPSKFVFEPGDSSLDAMDAECDYLGLYSRVVCNVDTFNGVATYVLPSDDILSYNRNYRKVFPYHVSFLIFTSQRSTAAPTQWGRVGNTDYYYLPPNDNDQFIPISRNLWGQQSTWLKVTNGSTFISEYLVIENGAKASFMLNDAYPLWSCIDVLLSQVAPNIKFAGRSVFSHFLYSERDAIAQNDNRLYLTPKSNVTNGDYQTPAQTAPITLKQIFEMLKNVYQCYWFLEYNLTEQSWILRIEHIWYFMNGMSYEATPAVGIDLTTIINKRNDKVWAFNTNSYEFEKSEMPERYQFGWMDDVTDIFKGMPIEVLSDFVEQGKVEEITVSNFTSDVDYMMMNPSAISPEGFALLNVNGISSGLYVPTITFYSGGTIYLVQNGYLAYHMLLQGYWHYNMPSKDIKIEGEVYPRAYVKVQKGKKQTVNVPLSLSDPDMKKLIKTGLGKGQIHQMSIRLTSRMAKTQLRYDTEV